MTIAIALVAGFLAGRLVWTLLRDAWRAPVLLRENYRGQILPTAAGLALPLTVVLVEAGRAVVARLGVGDTHALTVARAAVLAACVGFAMLGLLDDLAGDASSRGFRGHLRALAGGRLTTGGVKLLGGMALAVVVVAPWGDPGVLQLLADGAVVALAANLANLLDRAPGRSTKWVLVAFAALALATRGRPVLAAAAVVVGAGAALLLDDLHERLMIGDTGANALGAVVGLAAVQSTVPHVRLVILGGLVLANLSSEIVSFSRVIAAVPPLRAFDAVGRRPRRPRAGLAPQSGEDGSHG